METEDPYAGWFQNELDSLESYMANNYPDAVANDDGIYYIEMVSGAGDTAQIGQYVLVDYTGYLLDGTMFDSSIDTMAVEGGIYDASRDYDPILFRIGYNNIISGFQLSVLMMQAGDQARAVFPSSLGYGVNGSGSIPGFTSLIFDLHLREIEP
jgi:FKBP-type peptidyl-prolyl cis-trans isomerase